MPELPEVETTCRSLARLLVGRTITTVQRRSKKLRYPLSAGLVAQLRGRKVQAVARRAKYILLTLDDGYLLLVHLGMSGRFWRTDPAAPLSRHDHLVLTTADGDQFRYHDPRRFGAIARIAARDFPAHPWIRSLGPEPLTPDFTPRRLAAALTGRRISIKQALLDQRLVAGIGNIYASEALFHAGIDPRQPAAEAAQAADRLVPAIRSVLRAAIRAGGSSLRDYVQADGRLGFFQEKFAVYDRAGQPCPGCTCGRAGIARITQGGRATFFCPTRQPRKAP